MVGGGGVGISVGRGWGGDKWWEGVGWEGVGWEGVGWG